MGLFRKFPTRSQFRTRNETILWLLFFFLKLEYDCFTVLCVSAIQRWASATWPHLSPHPTAGHHGVLGWAPSLQQLPTCRAEPCLCSSLFLFHWWCWIHSNAMPSFRLPPDSCSVSTSPFSMSVSLTCPANRCLYTIFLDSIYMH